MENTKRKIYIGEVVSNRMDKSIVVLINRKKMHPLYKKFVNRKYKLMAHDEKNEAMIGDIVKVQETRPLSKRKRFRLIEIVKKAQTVD
ncbi:MAG: 30S ribosomal protein S17 [bacterium]|uniref:Small ribosomal subunit protein uS17 n=1 Tax=candidate division WOR-3 bacterium TaxID=2052148 RepID=A0A348MIM6_UNCW3|nr:MAG: 30S ribosomal protein S17 [candidate division TA06 bacterium 32_111]MDI6700070.1 30S ribosomal protein S17 [bacterium]HAF06902.1 30S ribosomal protein S17 [candidate division WOR-3 bacterium]HCP15959.1 30S ribosomal protein S17 [candidate division WOR-3 bacterium]